MKALYPNTELSIDLKLLTLKRGRLSLGDLHNGAIVRDGEYHYTFFEQPPNAHRPDATLVRRNPIVYRGSCINLHQNDRGELYPTFTRPQFSAIYTLSDFLREAAEELEYVARLVEKKSATR